MKKFLVVFALLSAIVLMISCGSDSKTTNKDENSDTGETVTDEDSADTGSTDTESGNDDSKPTENPDAGDSDTTSDSDTVSDDPCEGLDGAFYDEERNGCYCPEGYHWGEGEDSVRCVPGSDTPPNPCEGLEGAVFDEERHGCTCPTGYTWSEDDGGKRCVDNPEYHACIAAGGIFTEYSECLCPEGYDWGNGDESGKCVPIPPTSPCASSPCSGVENSNGGCVATGENTYRCNCFYNFVFDSQNNKCVAPECSPTSGTPCYDKGTQLYWTSYYTATWEVANATCYNLLISGFDDWLLPTIDELRTLFKGCARIEPDGICGVSETGGCLSGSCASECSPASDEECPEDTEGAFIYNKLFYDSGELWSSSVLSDDENSVWYISFEDLGVFSDLKSSDIEKGFRCVRKSN